MRYYRKRNRGAGKKVEEGFLDDPALQQVHITRKSLVEEVELEGLYLLEYLKLLGKQIKNIQ